METVIVIFLALMGMVVGVAAGLIGVGGALLSIPALLYVYPVLFPSLPTFPMTAITSITAVQSLAAGFSSARVHWKKGNTNLKLVAAVGGWSMLGGFMGGASTHWFNDHTLKVLYALLLSTVTLFLLQKHFSLQAEREAESASEGTLVYAQRENQNQSDETYQTQSTGIDPLKGRYLPVAAVSVLIGVSAGILGVGGAVFIMPVFSHWLKMPIRLAIGSTTGVTAMTCVASVLGKLQGGDFPFFESLLVSAGALLGANIGAKLSFKVSESRLLLLFLAVVIVTLLRVCVELVLGH
ncbi:MAG: sulfite exporter TauE/SafE family protein [Vampirovibrionales bacterium]|nr:sulfite exporter TauE/SafE family protein [Vampirovibrionales bacterium]